jgi:hypothetical protein
MAKIETSVLLNDLKSKTEFCIKEAKRFLKQSEKKLNDRPNPETWSALQCIDHLNQYGNYYIPQMETAMQNSDVKPNFYFGPGFIGNMFAKAMHPTLGANKMQAPADKVPSSSDLNKNIINTFIEQQKSYLEVLKTAEGKNLNKVKIKVTISKWVKLKLGDALRVTIFHNERHIRQAIKALKNN